MTSRSKLSGHIFRYSIASLLLLVTIFCIYMGYTTNRRRAELASPVPTAAYSPETPSYKFTEADFVIPFDPRTGTQRLAVYVPAIQARIDGLRKEGDSRSAQRMDEELVAIQSRDLSLPYPEPDGAKRLHAVGVHEGGNATISVTDTSGPIVLAVCAYNSVNWQISVAPEVQLERVIMGGYHAQTLAGLPDDIPVEGQATSNRQPDYNFYASRRPAEWYVVGKKLERLTGLEISTYQGSYSYGGSPFVVGPANQAWCDEMRADMLLPLYQQAVRPDVHKLAGKLVKETFPMVYMASPNRYGMGEASFATGCIFGPYADTLQPIESAVKDVAFLPHGPTFFAMKGRELMAIDPEDGSLSPVEVPGLDDPGHDPLIAIDHTKNRLYLWGRELRSIELLTKKVTVHRKDNPDLRGVTYSSSHDCLYGVCAPYDGNSHSAISEICRFNLRGAEVARVPLSVPIPSSTRGDHTTLVEIAGKLVIMPRCVYDGSGYATPLDINYVADPATGEVHFVCHRQPRPSPKADEPQ